MIILVLLQQGKGADAGATFGGGSNSLFGAGGADTFLTKATTTLAFLFMATAFTLAIRGNAAAKVNSRLFKDAPKQVEASTSPANETAETTSPAESATPIEAPPTENAPTP